MIDLQFEKFGNSLMNKFGMALLEEKEKLEERNQKFANLKARKWVNEKEKSAPFN